MPGLDVRPRFAMTMACVGIQIHQHPRTTSHQTGEMASSLCARSNSALDIEM